jgi:hypothetical protein
MFSLEKYLQREQHTRKWHANTPSPGNWDIVLVKSKTSSLSAWLDNEQPFTSFGTEQFHRNQLRLRRERHAWSHPPRFCRQKRQGQRHGAQPHWECRVFGNTRGWGRTERFRHDFCDLLLPIAGEVKRLPDNLFDATQNPVWQIPVSVALACSRILPTQAGAV